MKAASNTKPPASGTRARCVIADHQGRISELWHDFLARGSDCELGAEGHSNKEIADLLGLSPKTTEPYRSVVIAKLGMHEIASLTRAAVRRGLAP